MEGTHCGSSATAWEDLERGKDRAKTTGRTIAAATKSQALALTFGCLIQ